MSSIFIPLAEENGWSIDKLCKFCGAEIRIQKVKLEENNKIRFFAFNAHSYPATIHRCLLSIPGTIKT